MADPQNIQALLQQLAQSSTPLQQPPALPQQPPLPQGGIPPPYAAAYTTPQPAVQGGFVLPTPRSSGAVDLSSIRPSHSGSVNVSGAYQDALEKARSMASAGGNYGAGRDSRGGGRDYMRSRSRSPGRGNRDSYSAYGNDRSERRYPRGDDRPFSPGNVSTISGGPDHEVIAIESNLVGLIIGQQGKNLRKVEQDTNARVQFLTGPESSGPTRQCKISGPPQARAAAKAEINRIINENGNPVRGVARDTRDGGRMRQGSQQQQQAKSVTSDNPEDTLQIMVPNRTVGLIIGRAGETIKDLQERSGCHVNILGEDHSTNGLRPVNLIGPPSAQQIAKNMILEVVDSDNKNMGSGGGGGAPPRREQFQPTGDGAKIEATIHVPSEAVGMIIGKGGETIKDMQNVSGCKINVSQPSGRDIQREIGLVGTHGAIEAAKGLIQEKVRAVVSDDCQPFCLNYR